MNLNTTLNGAPVTLIYSIDGDGKVIDMDVTFNGHIITPTVHEIDLSDFKSDCKKQHEAEELQALRDYRPIRRQRMYANQRESECYTL